MIQLCFTACIWDAMPSCSAVTGLHVCKQREECSTHGSLSHAALVESAALHAVTCVQVELLVLCVTSEQLPSMGCQRCVELLLRRSWGPRASPSDPRAAC